MDEKTTTDILQLTSSKLIFSDQKNEEDINVNTAGGSTETSAALEDLRNSTNMSFLLSSSFWQPKLDRLYLGFFLTHIPVILRTSLS